MKKLLSGSIVKNINFCLTKSVSLLAVFMLLFVFPFTGLSQTYWNTEGNTGVIGKNKLGTTNDK